MPDHEYLPNSWVIIKVTKDEGVHYRVLAGFEEKPRLYSDDWRISKDITSVEEVDKIYHFYCSSGSCYKCQDSDYGLSDKTDHVWKALTAQKEDEADLMKDRKDWLKYEWTYIE